MELLGDKIDQRFSKYIAMKGIPENEVDEFDGLWNAYHNKLNGNHGRTQKYKYVQKYTYNFVKIFIILMFHVKQICVILI